MTQAHDSAGIRVVEAATLFAAPFAGMLLGDFGAEVIKIEHPRRPDPARGHGPSKDGEGLWFKSLARNKRLVTLDLSKREGADLFLRLVERSDVVLENFRPGTLERWGLGWDELSAVNPRLVLARVSGFGQTGPYAQRPGFGTLAEAMSGFAALNGEPDGPPLLPPLALADGVAGLATAFAVLAALRAREADGAGQVVDTSLVEPLLALLGPQLAAYDLLGTLQPRTGNRSSHNAPRNVYRTADGAWVAVSASADSVAARVLRLVGRPDLAEQPWFSTGAGRVEHVEEIDEAVARWIARARPRRGPRRVRGGRGCDRADLRRERHRSPIRSWPRSARSRTCDGVKMPNVIARLSETPGEIRHPGGEHGADTAAVLAELGVGRARAAARGRRRLSVPPLTWLYVPADRPRPGREGDRLGGARGDRRPRGRRRTGREGRSQGEPRARSSASARDKPVYVRVNAGDADDLEAVAALGLSGVLVPKVARPGGRPGARPPGPLPDRVRRRPRGRVRDRRAPRESRGSRSASPTSAPRPARSRRGSTGRGAGSSTLPSRPAYRGRRSPSTRTYATTRASRAPARAGASSATSAAPRSIPAQLPIIEQAYLPTAAEVERAQATVERLEPPGAARSGGEFVDAAMLGAARQVVELAARYGGALELVGVLLVLLLELLVGAQERVLGHVGACSGSRAACARAPRRRCGCGAVPAPQQTPK